MTTQYFLFNKCLRINSEGLNDCIKAGPTIGIFVGKPSTFEQNTMYFLKKKLKTIGVPLIWVDAIPEYVKKISTYSDMDLKKIDEEYKGKIKKY